MKHKKLALLALVGILTLTMVIPAFAGSETVINGKYEDILIDVIIMPKSTAQINPYGMPVKVYDTQATPQRIGSATLKTAGKIASQPAAMYNLTDVDLNVSASVSTSNVKGVELVTSPIPANTVEKRAFVFLEAKQDTTLTASDYKVAADTAGYIGNIEGNKLIAAFNAWNATKCSVDEYAETDSMVVVNPEAASKKKNIAVMKAADADGKPTSGGYVLYRLGGDCVEDPESAWKTTDGFDVKVAFTFAPKTTP